MRCDKSTPDSGEYHPKRWLRQWKTVNLKRKEERDGNKEKEQTIRENHEGRKTNSREQKWRRIGGKKKKNAHADEDEKKTQSQTKRQEEGMARG